MKRFDWEVAGREHARKVWAASDKKLEKLPLDPYGGLFEPQKPEEVSALRDGYRSELHLLNLRHESQTPVACAPIAEEMVKLSAMQKALRNAGLEEGL